jgi:hypothetical protein
LRLLNAQKTEKRKEKIGGSTKKLKGQFTWLASCTLVSKSRKKEKRQKKKKKKSLQGK